MTSRILEASEKWIVFESSCFLESKRGARMDL